MNYLSVAEVIRLHEKATDGGYGVLNRGSLESAVRRPRFSFAFQNPFSAAAAVMHSILRNHPFVDGNKRTAAVAAIAFLGKNGVRLTATNEQLEEFVVHAVERDLEVEAISSWLQEHATLGEWN